ncbi:MAG: hypothetical protein AAGK02_01130 [Pseudomonadota bacterium]
MRLTDILTRVLLSGQLWLVPSIAVAEAFEPDSHVFVVDLRLLARPDAAPATDIAEIVETIESIRRPGRSVVLIFDEKRRPLRFEITQVENLSGQLTSRLQQRWEASQLKQGASIKPIELSIARFHILRWMKASEINVASRKIHLVWFGTQWRFGSGPDVNTLNYEDGCIAEDFRAADEIFAKLHYEFRTFEGHPGPSDHAMRALMFYISQERFDEAAYLGVWQTGCGTPERANWPEMPQPYSTTLNCGASVTPPKVPARACDVEAITQFGTGSGGGAPSNPSSPSRPPQTMLAILTPAARVPVQPNVAAGYSNGAAALSRIIVRSLDPALAGGDPGISFAVTDARNDFAVSLILAGPGGTVSLPSGRRETQLADVGGRPASEVAVSAQVNPTRTCRMRGSDPLTTRLKITVRGVGSQSGTYFATLAGLHCDRREPIRVENLMTVKIQ